MIRVLYYREDSRFENQDVWLHSFAHMFGFEAMMVDRTGVKHKHPFYYESFMDAYNDPAHDGYTWVFLDHRSKEYLEDFEHPADNVIYCIGSDDDGYDGLGEKIFELEGKVLALKHLQGQDWWGAFMLQTTIYDRYLKTH